MKLSRPHLFLFLLFLWYPGLSGWGQSFDCEEELFSKKDRKTRLFGYVNALGEYRIPPNFLKALPFAGKNAIVQQGKRFGVINCEGVLVVPADYEEIASFTNGKGWVKTGGLWGLIDVRGRMLIAPQYEEVKEINPFSGTQTWVRKQGLWGLISKENGRMLLPPQYEEVSVISDSAAIGRKNALRDLVYTGDGRVIVPSCRQIRKLSRNLFAFQNPEKRWGAFNSLAYLLIRPEWSSLKMNGSLVQVEQNGLYGFRNLKGGEVTSPRFSFVQEFTEGFAAVSVKPTWQILNTQGEEILPAAPYSFAEVVGRKLAVVGRNQKFGLWDPTGRSWVLEPEFSSAKVSFDRKWISLGLPSGGVVGFDCVKMKKSDEVWDSLSIRDGFSQIRAYRNGKVTLTRSPGFSGGTAYDKAIPLSEGFVQCRNENAWGVVQWINDPVLPFEFSAIHPFATSRGWIFGVTKEGRTGLMGEKGQILLPLAYEDALPVKTGVFLVRKEGKWGIINGESQWILENKYDSIRSPESGDQVELDFPLLAYRKGKATLVGSKGEPLSEAQEGRWFWAGENKLFFFQKGSFRLFDFAGKPQGELRFDAFLPFSEGTAPVSVNGKWGFVNSTGRLVIPARFEEVLPYQNGIAFAKEGDLWGVLKKNGAWLVKPSGKSVETDEDGKRRLVMP